MIKPRIQPLTYVEGFWRFDGHSGYEQVRDETPAKALVRAIDFWHALGHQVLQVITLPNPASAHHPNFAFLYVPAPQPNW
jgi:hypothetical protein